MNTIFNFNQLKEEVRTFSISSDTSYQESYKEFIQYFKKNKKITRHNLYISSHFVYGWMPTIINLKIEDEETILKLLNNARKPKLLSEEELMILKKSINNSMVGLSKLLHFINPKQYPIWDRRVFRYLTKKKSSYGIDKPKIYLEYVSLVHEIARHKNYLKLHQKIEKKIGYEVSPMRAIEVVLFETDKKTQMAKQS